MSTPPPFATYPADTSPGFIPVNPTALYGERVDLRLFVVPGDSCICGGVWARVLEVRLHRARSLPKHAPIKPGWDAIEIKTDNGSRWFGYPARTLPTEPVNRRRPLW